MCSEYVARMIPISLVNISHDLKTWQSRSPVFDENQKANPTLIFLGPNISLNS
jgi:hypothetical protein